MRIYTRKVLDALKRLHGAGIVHRDVKPANLVLMGNRFRLIDFGAATDLRVGINYDPELSLLDPGYCPPEQYVMPGVCVCVPHSRCMGERMRYPPATSTHGPSRWSRLAAAAWRPTGGVTRLGV